MQASFYVQGIQWSHGAHVHVILFTLIIKARVFPDADHYGHPYNSANFCEHLFYRGLYKLHGK